jgi:aminomethyltransferase
MSNQALEKTPLHDWHVARGGRMVDFAGWSMPVQYSSIVEEHTATRTACGVFDVSHMGRLRFEGSGAAAFLDRLLTRRVVGLEPGKIRYSLVTNEQGGILDDVLVYHLEQPGHLPQSDGGSFHQLVVNASNREKIVAWVQSHLSAADDVAFTDQTKQSAMIAVQGPRALEIAQPLVGATLGDLEYYTGVVTNVGSSTGIASRTGYTGEDGCELIVPAVAAAELWEKIFELGADKGIAAAGLGARDTLRLEAAMPLYGHELSEQINPFQAGLGFAVHLNNRQFIGRDALAKAKAEPNQPKRVGLEMSGKRVPREHFSIYAGDEVVGEVTSGTFSPTLQKPIAMAYVRPDVAGLGTELAIDIRGRREPARVVKLPFYSRSKS